MKSVSARASSNDRDLNDERAHRKIFDALKLTIFGTKPRMERQNVTYFENKVLQDFREKRIFAHPMHEQMSIKKGI